MQNSINTNRGAITALQSLNRTNRKLEATEKRVATGFRVSDASDDGAAFAVAQGLRSQIKGYASLNERLSRAKGLMAVAGEGAKQISNTMAEIRSVLTKLADESVTGTQRTQYANQYTALKTEVQRYYTNSTFNGTNILSGGLDILVIGNLSGSSVVRLTGQNLTVNVYNILPAITGATSAATCATALGAGGAFTTAETNMGLALADLGTDTRTLDNTLRFATLLSDATSIGLGNIVDADLGKDSARLQSLQIRQQLGTQTLSMANKGPSALLNLFSR